MPRKTCQLRLSRNFTKFYVLARFRETIPTVQSVSSSEISPWVSYTHTEIRDISPGLLHPHRNLGSLPESLTPIQKFRISPRVSYTHTEIRDLSPGLLHPYRNSGSLPGSLTPILQASHLRGLTAPFLLCPTNFNYSSFPNSNYESSLDVVPKINSTHTHQEW